MTPHPRSASPRLAFVGSFTTRKRHARGRGIVAYTTGASKWRRIGRSEPLINPSFLTVDRSRALLLCSEGDGRHASSFAIDRDTGELEQVSRAAAGGLNGVHHALDPTGRFLIVANHDSGSLGVMPVAADGSLGDAIQTFDLPGETGPRREQFSAQPHQVLFDPSGRFLVVPAKGLDRIFVFELDRQGMLSLRNGGHAVMRPAAGPRHVAFHPTLPFLFVVNEIESSVALCGWDQACGAIEPLSVVSSLPPDTFAANAAAAVVVAPDGRNLYISNRGHDSVAQIAFEQQTTRMSPVEWVSANGKWPRFMTLEPGGRRLLVASEHDDRVSAFSVERRSGRLRLQGMVADCASPSAIDFL